MGGLTIQYAKLLETKKNSPLLTQKMKSSHPIKNPADRILFLQRTIGNLAVQQLIKSGTLQAKLRIGQPGDKYEQEADRVADAVMQMPEPEVQRQVEPEEEEEKTLQTKPLANQITPLVQVQRQEEPEEEEEMLQAKPHAEQITPLVQRQVEEEEEEEELQAKELPGQKQLQVISLKLIPISNLISIPLKAAASRCLNPSVPISSCGLELILARCGCIVMRRRLNLHGH